MRRLLAAVVLVDQTGHGTEIMRVHGRGQPVNHIGHQALSQAIPATRAFGLVSPTPISRATNGSPAGCASQRG
jgi:hypothetical protein